MTIVPPTSEGIREAAEAVRAGEIVAYPTETVYGLAADPFSEAAVERLFTVKERDRGKPVLLIVANTAQLAGVVSAVSPDAETCIRAFWPGPLSLLLPKAAWLAPGITAGAQKVCVRETSCPIARTLCEYAGHAVTSTSANRSGGEPARSLAELDISGLAVAIDGGLLPFSPPSTVYDPDERRIIREGAISLERLKGAMGEAFR